MFGGSLDTFTDLRLHSYRRDGARSGRMASLIWLLPATG
ncbi:MAG: multicopper polyphenol oxidase [Rhodanobacteraceae bacterium]|nr:MAG: multicopper polyphenol oxidase [Rhodanobacteraceae bacterium]